jgi:hypothetical protein
MVCAGEGSSDQSWLNTSDDAIWSDQVAAPLTAQPLLAHFEKRDSCRTTASISLPNFRVCRQWHSLEFWCFSIAVLRGVILNALGAEIIRTVVHASN